MGLFGRKSGGRQSEPIVALDIGTEVAKAVVFTIDADRSVAIVRGVGRVQQHLGNMQSGSISDISGVVETSRQAIAMAQDRAGVKHAQKAIVGIAGELVKGTTTTVHYERVDANLPIAISELQNIIERVQEKAYERIRQQIVWETGRDLEIKLINAAVVDVRIDGYRVTNPINFQGREVSMSIFNAYAPVMHLGAVQTIATELEVDLLNVAAEPYAVAMAASRDDMLDFSAIFIDIGGGTSDLAVVRNGGLEGTKMFALGGRAFTKKLMQVYDMGFAQAEDLKLRYSGGLLPENIAEDIRRTFRQDCHIWLNGVELSLTEFAHNDLLPPTIYLCGGGAALPGIRDALLTPEWVKTLPFARAPRVRFLQPRDITAVEDTTGELVDPKDITPMSLVGLAVDLATEEKILATLIRRAMRGVQK